MYSDTYNCTCIHVHTCTHTHTIHMHYTFIHISGAFLSSSVRFEGQCVAGVCWFREDGIGGNVVYTYALPQNSRRWQSAVIFAYRFFFFFSCLLFFDPSQKRHSGDRGCPNRLCVEVRLSWGWRLSHHSGRLWKQWTAPPSDRTRVLGQQHKGEVAMGVYFGEREGSRKDSNKRVIKFSPFFPTGVANDTCTSKEMDYVTKKESNQEIFIPTCLWQVRVS